MREGRDLARGKEALIPIVRTPAEYLTHAVEFTGRATTHGSAAGRMPLSLLKTQVFE